MKLSNLEQCSMTSEDELQKMIDEQVKLFQNVEEPFDYRKIFEDTEKVLNFSITICLRSICIGLWCHF